MKMKAKEIYMGKDIRKAFPKDEYNIEPLDYHITPEELYCIEEYKYQTNTVVFRPMVMWQEK